MLDSTREWIWHHYKYSHSNQQIRQYFSDMATRWFFFQQQGRRSSRTLRAKFWVSLVTGISTSGPLANVPVTRLTRYRHNQVAGTHFRCTKSVPVTSIYWTMGVYLRAWSNYLRTIARYSHLGFGSTPCVCVTLRGILFFFYNLPSWSFIATWLQGNL